VVFFVFCGFFWYNLITMRQERDIVCRDGHLIRLAMTLPSAVVEISCPDFSDQPIAQQGLVGPNSIHPFRCEWCTQESGCAWKDGLTNEQRLTIYLANSGHGASAVAQEAIFSIFVGRACRSTIHDPRIFSICITYFTYVTRI